jgi:hypothetical protein
MKMSILLITVLILFTGISHAQDNKTTFKIGGGIVDSYIPGATLAIDAKISKTPLSLSPYINYYYYSPDDGRELYFGLDLLITKQFPGLGLFAGLGGGIARWNWYETARTSPCITPLIGMSFQIVKNIGIFGEGKWFVNTKSKKDTEAYNNGHFGGGTPFGNEFSILGGLCFGIN